MHPDERRLQPDPRIAALVDALLAQCDRYDGNVVVSPSGAPIMIDNASDLIARALVGRW